MLSKKILVNPFEKLLKEKPWILADGATGTQLFKKGLTAGESPEIWNETKPLLIEEHYKSSIEAGSDLILTNSFGSNYSRLKLHNAESEAFRLSEISAEIARNLSDQSPKHVIVAGSMGPTGEILQPVGDFSKSLAIEIFHEQAEGLKSGGSDILWIETMSSLDEFDAAVQAADLAQMPFCGTMSFDTSGRTMMGVTSVEFCDFAKNCSKNLIAYGANCGVGASDLLRTILGLKANTLPIIAKGNAGIPKYSDGKIYYNGTPEIMADYACLARDCGATIIGGCCGTTPLHLRHMNHALHSRSRGPLPTHQLIKNILGDFSSTFDGTGETLKPSRTSKRRSRRLIT